MFGLPKIEIGDGFFRQVNAAAMRVEAIGARLDDFRIVFKRILWAVIIPSIIENFEQQGRPERWQTLSESRISARRGSRRPILVWSEDLMTVAIDGSSYKISKDTLQLTSLASKIPYAGFNQFGTSVMPARPFILYQDQDIENIVQWFEAYIDRVVESHWGFDSPGLSGAFEDPFDFLDDD